MRARGRKPPHPKPLPDVEALAAMRTFEQVRHKERWDSREALKQMREAPSREEMANLSLEELDLAEFEIDPATFSKVLICNVSLNHKHKWAVFLWMRQCYGALLHEILANEQVHQKERSLAEWNNLLGNGRLHPKKLAAFQGSFNLIRPYYQDPARYLITQRLIIGSKDSLFDCVLSSDFEDHQGYTVNDHFTGKVVPHGFGMLGMLTTPDPVNGIVVAHFDEIDDHAGGRIVNVMKGIMITAIGRSSSSAWPFYARRAEKDSPIPFPFVGKSDFDKLPAAAVEAMRRGAVHWNPAHYPTER